MFYDMGVIYYGGSTLTFFCSHPLPAAGCRWLLSRLSRLHYPDETHAVGEFCSSTASRAATSTSLQAEGRLWGAGTLAAHHLNNGLRLRSHHHRWRIRRDRLRKKIWCVPAPRPVPATVRGALLIRHCLLTLPVSLISLLYGHSGSIWQER